MKAIPTTDFYPTKVWVIEWPPVDMGSAAERLFVPPEKLEIVFDRMVAERIDVQILIDTGRAHRAPDLDYPAEDTEMIVDPVERPADHLLWVVTEFMVDGNIRVPGELAAFGADLLKLPQIFCMHLGIGQMIERAQQDAAPGMERDASGYVRMANDELGNGPYFRFRGGKWPGAQLLVFLAPISGKVAI